MSRTDQVNSLLQQELANLLQQYVQIDGVLLTITGVDCSPDLRRAKIGISVLPDQYYGTALTELRTKTKLLRQRLAGRVRLQFIPKLFWQIDNTEKEAAKIEEVLAQL
ncbi:MAG: Ribosome-binding factor A [Candidatus Falkowbacteria bacterium GW2011_GWA2_39_24]|uniref:Ribosome-binding factor A n=1 Tax=Candidatus Falkowbacteria bacterium GW2011_GWA2_39_24 TaxID=1618634 RepID=A0A0G0RMM2_9BACT|nr:MAG: Ribosome-binding factor A [Candidatus Falkowbacteria bacterium GW2011_GWA2_39_24]